MTLRLFLAAAVLAVLPACQSLSNSPGGDDALAELSGIWVWSHAGKPSIQSPKVDPATIIDENMADSKISLNPDGSASMLAVGQARSFTVELSEETPLFIKLGSPDNPDLSLTYEKATKRLMFPMPLTIEDDEGTISAYYKRQR